MKYRLKKLALLTIFLYLAACQPSTPEDDIAQVEATQAETKTSITATAPPLPQLDDTEWVLVSVNGRQPISNSRITLTFNDGSVGGYAGCNTYASAAYTLTATGTIALAEMPGTQQLCLEPEGVMEQETAYLQALRQIDRFTLSDEALQLMTADNTTTLIFSRQEQFDMNATDLIGTAWRLDSWDNRELLPGTEITLIFESAEAMRGFAGCRHYTGNYFAEKDRIYFPQLGMVETDCEQGEALLIQEGDFTTILSQATQYRLQDGQLELFTNPGEHVVFVPLLTEADSAPTPESTTTPQLSFVLGEPQTMGRGQIRDAVFTADGAGVAIAWANGVSFTAVSTAGEKWFHPLPAAPIAIDVQADGQAVAVALADGSVAVLGVNDGRFQIYPVAHANAYWGDIAYAPDGSRIAVQFIGPNRADPIFLLDVAGGMVSEVPKSQGSDGTMPYLVWSPDSTMITLASLASTCAHILDVQTGERLFKLQHPDGCYDAYAVVWSADSRFLILAGPNSTIDIIEFAGQTVSQSIPGAVLSFAPTQAGQPLFASPDGRWLAGKGGLGFYGDRYPLLVWETATGQQVLQAEVTDLTNPRLAGGFAGDVLVSLFADGTLTRWAFAEESATEQVVGQLPVYGVRVPFVWSPDGRKLASATDTQFVIWDVDNGRPLAVFDTRYEAPAFSPDARFVALTDPTTNELIVVDLDNNAVLHTFEEVTARVEGVAFAPDGRFLAYGSGNKVVVVDVATGVETAVLTGYPANQTITKILWSPTGTALVAAGGVVDGEEAPGTIIVWEQTTVGDYREVFRAENVRTAYTISVRPVALFNPSGTLVALENLPRPEAGQFKIFVYDLEQNEQLLQIDGYQLSAWLSDEQLLTSEEQYYTRLTQWDVRTGASLVGQAGDNGGLSFAPTDGFYAQAKTMGVAIGRGVEVRHWQSNLVLAEAPLGSDMMQVAWSPDGRFLAASAGDGSLTVWPVLRSGN